MSQRTAAGRRGFTAPCYPGAPRRSGARSRGTDRRDPRERRGAYPGGNPGRGRGGCVDGLGRRVLVAAFDGWNDAGEAASAALAQLREGGSYEPAFSVDPELYFDYQYTRPQIAAEADGRRLLQWPEATLHRPVRSAR